MTESLKFANTTLGAIPCPACGTMTAAKVNKKGHVYVYCLGPADGGCGGGFTSRSDKADGLLAAQVTQWRNPDVHAHYKAMAPATAADVVDAEEEIEADNLPEPSPAPKPALPSAPSAKAPPRRSPAKTVPKEKPWWDQEL